MENRVSVIEQVERVEVGENGYLATKLTYYDGTTDWVLKDSFASELVHEPQHWGHPVYISYHHEQVCNVELVPCQDLHDCFEGTDFYTHLMARMFQGNTELFRVALFLCEMDWTGILLRNCVDGWFWHPARIGALDKNSPTTKNDILSAQQWISSYGYHRIDWQYIAQRLITT